MTTKWILLAVSLASALVPWTTSAMEQADKEPTAAAAPIARRTGWVNADDGVRIYYEVCGSGPAIVFVHGLGGNHAVWFNQVAHFAVDHTVVTLSQRGFAPSGGDPNHYDVELLRRDLEDVMDAAGVKSAVVVGQSMGGWTVLNIALKSPARVEALVLADTLGGIDDESITAQRREISASAAKLASTPPPMGVHPALAPAFSRERPDLAYLYQTLATFGSPSPDKIVNQLFGTKVGPAELAKLVVPTLFVVGSEDRLFPPDLIRKGAASIKGARVEIIQGAGHSPYFETPDAWNALVARVLSQFGKK